LEESLYKTELWNGVKYEILLNGFAWDYFDLWEPFNSVYHKLIKSNGIQQKLVQLFT